MDKYIFLYRWLPLWLIAVNLVTFALFGTDKRRAVLGRWRIRESVLLGASLIGGAAGGLLAMRLFRHKTRKWYFAFGVPLMLMLQAVLLWHLYGKA